MLKKALIIVLFASFSLSVIAQDTTQTGHTHDTLLLNGLHLSRKDFQEKNILKYDLGLLAALRLVPGLEIANYPGTYLNNSFTRGNTTYIEGLPIHSSLDMNFLSVISEKMVGDFTFRTIGNTSDKPGISSVCDITLYPGNSEEVRFDYSQSLLTTDMSINGPLGERTTFNAGLRLVPWDIMFRLANLDDTYSQGKYDVNLVVETSINNSNTIKFFSINNPTIFINEDSFKETEFIRRYRINGLSWRHTFNRHLNATVLAGNVLYMERFTGITDRTGNDSSEIFKEKKSLNNYLFDAKLHSARLKNNSLDIGVRLSMQTTLFQHAWTVLIPDGSYSIMVNTRVSDAYFYLSNCYTWKRFRSEFGFITGMAFFQDEKEGYFSPHMNISVALTDNTRLIADAVYGKELYKTIDYSAYLSPYFLDNWASNSRRGNFQLGLLSKLPDSKYIFESAVFYNNYWPLKDYAFPRSIYTEEASSAGFPDLSNADTTIIACFYGVNGRLSKTQGRFTAELSYSIPAFRLQRYFDDSLVISRSGFSNLVLASHANYKFGDRFSGGIMLDYYNGSITSFHYSSTQNGFLFNILDDYSYRLRGGIYVNFRKEKENSLQNFFIGIGPLFTFKYTLSL